MQISVETIVIVVLALVVAALAWAMLRARPAGPAGDEPTAADLHRQLAVEQQKALAIPRLEAELRERDQRLAALADAKATADATCARSGEALSRVEAANEEQKTRLAILAEQLDVLRRDKTALDEALAGKLTALAHTEAANADLRERLAKAEQGLVATQGRLEASVRSAAQVETRLGEQATALAERDRQIAALQEEMRAQAVLLNQARAENAGLGRQLATVSETLDQERRQATEKLALLTEARDQMTKEFKLLADTVMKAQSETFSKQNQEQIDGLLHPLRLKIVEFQEGLQKTNLETTRERATLAEQIRSLSETSARMTTETTNLTRALKGQAQTQGAWGEMILASILERSGLRANEEYFEQQSHTDDEGQRVRPDVVVRLPGNQTVVIDSKVSLVAFEAYVAAETDIDRKACAVRHVASLRSHVRGLSGKKYHDVTVSHLDYVIMFIPIEGALALALQEDAELTSYAVQNNVAIATPTTLMIALRTIANIWHVERRTQNAEAIATRAGRIYDKLVGFLEDMALVGQRLTQSQSAYNDAMGKLSSGRGNLVTQVSQLKVLGAKTNKSIPAALVEESDTLIAAASAEGIAAASGEDIAAASGESIAAEPGEGLAVASGESIAAASGEAIAAASGEDIAAEPAAAAERATA